MRVLMVFSLATLCAIASADELIDIPTARKILYEDFRYEFRAEPISGGGYEHFLGLGIGKSFELDIRDIVNRGMSPMGTFDLAYNVVPALPGITPAISFGVQDASNTTTDGRRFYAVTTFRNTMDELPGNVYADITLGIQVGSLTSPFIGVSVPFAEKLYMLAEDTGFRVNAGLEYRPSPKVAVRYIVRDNKTMFSLSATSRF